ncbi:MAG: serine/threonine protein kinase [Myxococcota bacterium]|nr:serine/threonine protein kinase [Myxococcota bacterium]
MRQSIGRGGMGAVFEAQHAGLQRIVALKILPGPVTRPEFERFLSEAQLTAAVRHPNVVSVLDFGVQGGQTPYLVLERLEGEPLSAMIRRCGKLFWRQAVEICDQILSGLSAAHKAGVVHRDLTPDNIFICHDENGNLVAKILDFGLALLTRSEQVDHSEHGVVCGTPGYLAPEAALGLLQIDARADLFSVGVILYELICGRLPFEGETPGDILTATLDAPVVRPTRYARGLPPPLERLILTAIARRPEHRYESAADMLEVLGAAAVGRVHEKAPICRTEIVGERLDTPHRFASTISQPPLPPVPPHRSWSRVYAVVALLVVAAIVLTFLMLREVGTNGLSPPLSGRASARGKEISVWLDALPPDLAVEWNGHLVQSRPLIVPRSKTMAKVRFFAKGYEAQERLLRADRDQTVRIQLRRVGERP